MTLKEFFEANPKAALAFSGGTDSAYLLWAAVQAGAEVQPYFVRSAFQPRFELKDAERLCAQLGLYIQSFCPAWMRLFCCPGFSCPQASLLTERRSYIKL